MQTIIVITPHGPPAIAARVRKLERAEQMVRDFNRAAALYRSERSYRLATKDEARLLLRGMPIAGEP